ncbi:MAG: PIN domain-containing protein [Arcobacteraceae bacterium]|jgi:predicted nucleic acid-binding protein|nr:PIN domain-containing protein [Arcobacteraceae bacterium]
MTLIDANIIIRFLVGDNVELFEKSKSIFQKIENRQVEVVILESVLMECFFVLVKVYKLPKIEVINDLKSILSLDGVVNYDKIILFETLNILESQNIDFVDALICAKVKLQGFKVYSFDKDIDKCINK